MLRSVTEDVQVVHNTTDRPLRSSRSCNQTKAPILTDKVVNRKFLLDKETVNTECPLQSGPLQSDLVQGELVQSRSVTDTTAGIVPLVNPAFRYKDFARQLALTPGATGAIAPSSKRLAKKTIRQADLADADTVVELGPGTGVFTEEILQNIRCDQTFFAIELNQTFVNATKNRCPDACIYHDAASSLPVWLEKHNSLYADRIISSLPWTIFDKPEQNEMMGVISDSLAQDGVFVSIVYLGARFRSRGRYFINNLQHHFSSVTRTPTVWQNLPPTQIFRCVK